MREGKKCGGLFRSHGHCLGFWFLKKLANCFKVCINVLVFQQRSPL